MAARYVHCEVKGCTAKERLHAATDEGWVYLEMHGISTEDGKPGELLYLDAAEQGAFSSGDDLARRCLCPEHAREVSRAMMASLVAQEDAHAPTIATPETAS